jgi:SNF2 family DNA or RNA helicase
MLTHLELIEFQENAAEQQIQVKVDEIGKVLGDSERAAFLYRSILLRSLASSPAALEDCLRTLRNQLAHGNFENVVMEEDEVSELESPEPPLRFSCESGQLLIRSLEDCLVNLESNSLDSKLDAFVEKVARLRDNKQTSPMCILTEFRATLFYLESQLQEMGFDPLLFHGTMSYDERENTVNEFKQSGGILLATNAGMEGLSLAEVESLFLYDIPWDPRRLQQVCGRFQRFGRRAPLNVYLLSDPKAGSVVQGLTGKLKELCR